MDSRPIDEDCDVAVVTSPARDVAPIWRLTLKRVDPLVVLNQGDVDPHVYCIHPISGDVVGLRRFAELFGARHLHGIQVPKAQMNATFGASIEGMATSYVDLLTARQPEGPIHLVGWSAGAIIALDMARQLRARGREVPLLVALDGAPCNTGAGLRSWDPRYIAKLALNLPRWIRDDRNQDWSWRGIKARIESKLAYRFGLGVAPLEAHQTMDADTVQKLVEGTGWTPAQKAFIRAMYHAMVNYVPAPYDGRVVVYETKTQPLIHLRQIGAAWKKIAARTEIVQLDGNHSGIVFDPMIGIIAGDLLGRLEA